MSKSIDVAIFSKLGLSSFETIVIAACLYASFNLSSGGFKNILIILAWGAIRKLILPQAIDMSPLQGFLIYLKLPASPFSLSSGLLDTEC
jgi:hypothetical protein